MIWRNRWTRSVLVGALLLAVTAAFILWDVNGYSTKARRTFRASCLQWVVVFEEFAEDWIMRDDLRSLESATQLFLMGSGLYVDVVVDGETVLLSEDEDLERATVDPLTKPPAEAYVLKNREGAVEVRAPIALSGHPDAAIGFLRIGFSDEYASAQIRKRTLTASGIGLASWLAAVSAVGLALRVWRKGIVSASAEEMVVCCGGLSIDTRTCEARLDGELLSLTPKQYDLLSVLARAPGTVFSDEELLKLVWPDSPYASSADVNQHIYLLRRKLAAAHPNPKSLIENVRGFGYRFAPSRNEEELSGR